MPIYQFRFTGADGKAKAEDLGFYHDEAALGHAVRAARGGSVEVWLESRLVGAVAEPQPVQEMAPAP